MNASKSSVMLKQLIQKSSLCQKKLLNPRFCRNSALAAIPLRFLTLADQKLSLTKMKIQQTPITPPADMEPNAHEMVTISRPCTVHDRDDMIKFMSEHFASREPLMKSLGANPRNSRKFISYCIDEALEQKASFVAIDDETGQICGLRVNAIGPSNGSDLDVDFGPNMNAIPKFLHFIEGDVASLLDTNDYMRHVAICVKPSTSQCGIASDLMRLSLDFAKQMNLKYITAMCSWKLPYKLAAKMGYTLVRELSYRDYADKQVFLDPEHRNAFLSLAATEEKARIMVKKL